ncbi:basic proline-rich protein-like [Ammospiza caudacuta]|uniref:basic proline-rich protein-like n=1 Tax=Ammospiza caudacuta TaxID=2857398 RepID=UPI00273855B1|nr:basic proline-rich protein-like [Ammospiza caudacuta]
MELKLKGSGKGNPRFLPGEMKTSWEEGSEVNSCECVILLNMTFKLLPSSKTQLKLRRQMDCSPSPLGNAESWLKHPSPFPSRTDKEPIASDAVRPSPEETSCAPRGERHSPRPGRGKGLARHPPAFALLALGTRHRRPPSVPGRHRAHGGARRGGRCSLRCRAHLPASRDTAGHPGRCGAPGALPAPRRLFLRPAWPRRSPAGGHPPAGGGPPGTGAPCSRRPPRAPPGRQGRRRPGPVRPAPPAGGWPCPGREERAGAGGAARGRCLWEGAAEDGGRAGGPAPPEPRSPPPPSRPPAPPLSPPSRAASSSSSSPGRGAAAAALAEPGSCAFSR